MQDQSWGFRGGMRGMHYMKDAEIHVSQRASYPKWAQGEAILYKITQDVQTHQLSS